MAEMVLLLQSFSGSIDRERGRQDLQKQLALNLKLNGFIVKTEVS